MSSFLIRNRISIAANLTLPRPWPLKAERGIGVKLRPVRLLAAIAWFCVASWMQAQKASPQIAIHLDPQKTEIHWTLHDFLHTVKGTFRLKSGTMTFNPQTGTAEGELLVDISTGESGNSTRDRKMQDEVLESKKYPEATFHPTKVSGTISSGATQNVTVEGTFNIHGAEHPLTLQFSVQVNGTDATAMTRFIVPYVDWGMKDASKPLLKVDNKVTVDVVACGTINGLRQNQ